MTTITELEKEVKMLREINLSLNTQLEEAVERTWVRIGQTVCLEEFLFEHGVSREDIEKLENDEQISTNINVEN